MPKFHGYDRSLYDHRRAEASSKPQKQHHSSLIASEGLHGSIVHDSHRNSKRFGEIEIKPSTSKIMRLKKWTIITDASWIADRDDVVRPILSELPHARHHLTRRQLWTGREFAAIGFTID